MFYRLHLKKKKNGGKKVKRVVIVDKKSRTISRSESFISQENFCRDLKSIRQ